jgi:hypothetical protein
MGLVASLNRPGANLTGSANLAAELAPKRLQLLRELIGLHRPNRRGRRLRDLVRIADALPAAVMAMSSAKPSLSDRSSRLESAVKMNSSSDPATIGVA